MKQVKTYLAAVQELRKLISEQYAEGGWLPGGRTMAKQQNISHATYCKALKCIEDEGLVKSYPNKGHYAIPAHLRTEKIGLILGDGYDSPFLQYDRELSAAMNLLNSNGFSSQIIQAASLDQIADNTFVQGVKGVLWFFPTLKAIPVIQHMNIPLVVMHYHHPNADYGNSRVIFDIEQIKQKRTEFLINRGHKNIAYIGSYENGCHNGTKKAFKKFDIPFEQSRCLAAINQNPEQLIPLLNKHQITGILSEGGNLNLDYLCKELSKLPDDKQPEVIIPFTAKLDKLRAKYPKVNIIDTNLELSANIGEEAAKMLVNHIQKNSPLQTIKIGYNEINEE